MKRVKKAAAVASPRRSDIHESVGLMDPVPLVTPATAIKRLSRIFRDEFGFTNLGASRSKPIDARQLWEHFNAPTEYERRKPRNVKAEYWAKQKKTAKYSYPKEPSPLFLRRPTYGWAYDDPNSPIFSWVLGLARTEHDPKRGMLEEETWLKQATKPDHSPPLDVQKTLDNRVYPTDSYNTKESDRATCWARTHIIFPLKGRPYVGVSGFQNLVLHTADDDAVQAEYQRLFDNSTGK